jgi:hypothetical protein
LSLAIEEKHGQVCNLVNLDKERGYLLYDEVSDIIQPVKTEISVIIDASWMTPQGGRREKEGNAQSLTTGTF